MSTKIKNNNNFFDQAHKTAANAGIVLMALAATAGLIDASHSDKRAVLPVRPVFAFAGAERGLNTDNTLRRERDDIAPHFISYSVYQRTPGRHGTQ